VAREHDLNREAGKNRIERFVPLPEPILRAASSRVAANT
jgi:hypothetical protein